MGIRNRMIVTRGREIGKGETTLSSSESIPREKDGMKEKERRISDKQRDKGLGR